MFQNPAHRTAVHESGHAVAALHLGVRFEAVELRIRGINGFWHCDGRLRGAELPDDADNRRLWPQLIVVMAGYAALSLFEQPTAFSLREFTFPDNRDYAAAADILHSMQPAVTETQALHTAMGQAWNDARQIVTANWASLTTIADELVRRSHPHGETVACLIALTPQDLSKLLPVSP
jgi:hypothetical protein